MCKKRDWMLVKLVGIMIVHQEPNRIVRISFRVVYEEQFCPGNFCANTTSITLLPCSRRSFRAFWRNTLDVLPHFYSTTVLLLRRYRMLL